MDFGCNGIYCVHVNNTKTNNNWLMLVAEIDCNDDDYQQQHMTNQTHNKINNIFSNMHSIDLWNITNNITKIASGIIIQENGCEIMQHKISCLGTHSDSTRVVVHVVCAIKNSNI